MKTCSRCGETKPAMMFSKRTASQDGLQHQCKSCKNIENSEYRASNPEKEKARNANYHAALNLCNQEGFCCKRIATYPRWPLS